MESKAAEGFYRAFYEHSLEASLLGTADGRILAANPAACRLFGKSEEQLCREGRAGLVDESAPAVVEYLAARQRQGQARAELELHRGDGSTFPCEISACEYKDADGETRAVLILRDISERKQLEAERGQFQQFFLLSSEPMCIADPFGCFLRVNPALVALTGYSEAELVSRPFLDFVVAEDRERTAEEMRLQVAQRPSLHFENRYLCKSGRVVQLSWSAYFNASDGVTYATARDVTEQRRAEAAWADSQAQLQAIFESSDDPIWSVEAGDEHRLLSYNHAFVRHFQRQGAQVVARGVPFAALIPDPSNSDQQPRQFSGPEPGSPPDSRPLPNESAKPTPREAGGVPRRETESDRAAWQDRYRKALTEGSYTGDCPTEFGDRTLRVSLNLLRRGSETYGISAFAVDITDRKAAEARLQTISQYYVALSLCNEAIVRATNESDLFTAVCEAAVKVDGIELAWVGMLDDHQQVAPVAAAGRGQAYLDGLHITAIPGDPHSDGPTGTAIRENRPYWCHDFLQDARLSPWRERGRRFGWKSSAALPLCRNGRPVGALTLYMCDAQLLTDKVCELLSEMASDISYALDGFARDSDRRRAEQALASSEGLLRQVLQSSIDGIFISDPVSGDILSANRAACALLGRSEAEILRIGRSGVLNASDPNLTMLVERRATLGHARGELEFIHADGHRIPTEVSSAVFQGSDGRQLASVILRDISERRSRESEIRKLSLAVEQSPESIVITDLASRIEYVNEAMVKVSGYSRAELLGQTPKILRSGQTPQATYDAMWEALHRGEPWRGLFVNRRKDGEIYTELALIAPIRQPDGLVTHYLALKDDVTEKMHMSEELDNYRRHLEELVAQRTAELGEARVRAEDANRAKSAFLANMSHEIRTPMNAILGLTYLMRQAQPTPEQSTRLDKVAVSARHLLSLIDDILDLSKIEAGRMAVESVDFEVAAVLRDVCDILRSRAVEKGLVVTRAVDSDVPPVLRGDPLRLRQVLINLGGNAVKFTQHGAVALRVRREPGEGNRGLRVRFEIADTCIGIDAEQRAHLFQPFEQADTATTRRFGGTGLGLAISRRLVELMGGTLDMASTPGRGSTFWFELPFGVSASTALPDLQASPQAAAAARPLRILVAEDERINQEVARELLESVGHRVDIAEDGAAAVTRAANHRYDVVLMDVQMPVMDGLEATRQLRALPAYATTPILAMTANAFEDDRRRCLEAGMNDFISKPVDPDRMFATLRRWTGEQPGQPAGLDQAPAAEPIATADTGASERVLAVQALDTPAGLRVVQGQWPAYERLLRRFASDHAHDVMLIRQFITGRQYSDARRTAHTLKGIAATIGAAQLHGAATRLEIALRSGSDEPANLAELVEAVDQEHSQLVGALRAALPPAPQPSESSQECVDWSRARYVLRMLEAYLVADDVWAGSLFSDNANLMRAALGSAAPQVELMIQSFDFSSALAHLRAAKANIPQLHAGDGRP
ncbi:MAG: PAS domain S-box protein [Deltaproteobacteria bacterium]|nr:PAS domain S-box protein [Deltaproteobacteria bacterium]